MGTTTNLLTPSSIPADVLRDIFSYFQPKELLRLCGVCRDFRTVSLVVLFTIHRSIFHTTGISFSSSSITDLASNLRSIRRVTCHAREATVNLTTIVTSLSRMLDLEELKIRFLPAIDRNKIIFAQQLTGSFARRQRKPLPPAIFMISKNEIKVFGGQRPLPLDWQLFVPRLRLPLHLNLVFRALRTPFKYLGDPMTAEWQETQTFRDIGALRKIDKYTTINLKSLPSLSPIRSWNLLILDIENVRAFTIGHFISTHHWGLFLPHLHLPALEQLAVCKDVKLSTSVLFKFSSRHPKICLLSFEHYSLSFDVRPADQELQFTGLSALEAPLHYFDRLLPLLDTTHLYEVSIGKHPYNKVHGQQPRPAHRILQDRLEKRFNFSTLDSILYKLGHLPIQSLVIIIPGGRGATAWLERCGRKGRTVPILSQVETVLVRSEFDVPFTQKVASLFPNLRSLCPAMTKFRCRRVNAPRGRLPFPPSIAQEIGYVCAINDQPEVVDAFANIRCAACGHYER